MIKIEFDINNVDISHILPIIYDKFEEVGESFDIRNITTNIEFILIADSENINMLFEQIKFINIVFRRTAIITIRLSSMYKLKYNKITKFKEIHVDNVDCVVDEIEELNGYFRYRLQENFMNIREYDININMYAKDITYNMKMLTHYTISDDVEHIRRGDTIQRL